MSREREQPRESRSDSDLLSRAARGDREAFGDLYERYLDEIYRYLYYRVADQAEVEDMTEMVFLKTWEVLPGSGAPIGNFRAWLYRVASRLATDDHRRRKLLEWLPLSGAEPDPEPSVEATATNRIAVQEALDALPPKYRIPLVLHAYAGCTVAEIAQTLGLSESGVKSRLSRARIKFRQAYGQEEDQ